MMPSRRFRELYESGDLHLRASYIFGGTSLFLFALCFKFLW